MYNLTYLKNTLATLFNMTHRSDFACMRRHVETHEDDTHDLTFHLSWTASLSALVYVCVDFTRLHWIMIIHLNWFDWYEMFNFPLKLRSFNNKCSGWWCYLTHVLSLSQYHIDLMYVVGVLFNSTSLTNNKQFQKCCFLF